MILPTKHLPIDRSLIAVGADIIQLLDEPKSVSRIWLDLQEHESNQELRLSFDWFTLALVMLYSIGAIEQKGNRLCRRGAQL
ncbi:ABC-three component system middle component 6 [Lacunimicrobium album]